MATYPQPRQIAIPAIPKLTDGTLSTPQNPLGSRGRLQFQGLQNRRMAHWWPPCPPSKASQQPRQVAILATPKRTDGILSTSGQLRAFGQLQEVQRASLYTNCHPVPTTPNLWMAPPPGGSRTCLPGIHGHCFLAFGVVFISDLPTLVSAFFSQCYLIYDLDASKLSRRPHDQTACRARVAVLPLMAPVRT